MAAKAIIMTTVTSFMDSTTNNDNNTVNTTTTTNRTRYAMQSRSGWRSLQPAFSAMHVLGAVWSALILAACLTLFLVVLSSAELRRKARNHILLSLTLAHLIVGCLGAPFVADYGARRTYDHGCYFNIVQSLVVLSAENFVSMWGPVQLLVLYVARLRSRCDDGPEWLQTCGGWGASGRRVRQGLHGLLVVSPWLAAALLVVPVAWTGVMDVVAVVWSERACPLILSFRTWNILSTFCYYIPAPVLIALGVAAVVLHRRRGGAGRGGGGGETAEGEKENACNSGSGGVGSKTPSITSTTTTTTTVNNTNSCHGAEMGQVLVKRDNPRGESSSSPLEEAPLEAPLVYLLTAGASLLCLGPEHFKNVFIYRYRSDMRTSFILYVAFELFDDLVAVLHVLTWLALFADLRQRLQELVGMGLRRLPCCPGRAPPQSSGDTNVAPVSFRDLRNA